MSLPLQARMAHFLRSTEPLGPAAQIQAFRAELTAQGSNMDAAPADTSDGYAVALFGIQAIGICEGDACRLWLCLARTAVGGWSAIDMRHHMRPAQITWAAHVISLPRCHSREALAQACRIILTLSSNTDLLQRATDFATAQNLFPLNLQPTA